MSRRFSSFVFLVAVSYQNCCLALCEVHQEQFDNAAEDYRVATLRRNERHRLTSHMLAVSTGLLVMVGRISDALADTRAVQERQIVKFEKYFANRAVRESADNIHREYHVNSFWDISNVVQAAKCSEAELLALLGYFDEAQAKFDDYFAFANTLKQSRVEEGKAMDGPVSWERRHLFAESLLRNDLINLNEVSEVCRSSVRNTLLQFKQVRYPAHKEAFR
jgi:hypothetical protein